MRNTIFILIVIALVACKSGRIQEEPVRSELESNVSGEGPALYLEYKKGESHNHPSFVLWAEDMDGNFIQTLFITKAVGTSIFEHGDNSSGHWESGEIRRPASLPYWAHKRGIKAGDGLYVPSVDNPIADAFTGATPSGDFGIRTKFDSKPPGRINIYFEINQTWDWNEYWNNNKYPGDKEYDSSCQPALVYMTEVNFENPDQEFELKVIGHSHYAGKTGELFTDLSTLTSALDIVGSLSLKLL